MDSAKQENNPRPKLVEVTAPNGFKTLTSDVASWTPLKSVLEFKARPDDVFIVAYPKSGSTWLEEILWLICNKVDIEKANHEPISLRVPFFDILRGIQSLYARPLEKQRLMKTHHRYEILPEDLTVAKMGKIIYVARNPKDVCVSFYHFHLMNSRLPFPGTWDEFFAKYCSGQVAYGSWFQHVLKFWEEYQKDKKRIYFTTYEALHKDFPSEVSAIAKFMGKELTEGQITAIADHCTFSCMSKNKMTNYDAVVGITFDFKVSKFMRKGQVGDWKNYLTVKQNEAFDEMYAEKFKGTGLDILVELWGYE